MMLRASVKRRSASAAVMSWNQSMSPPAQKARPAPVTTTARASASRAISANTRASSVCIRASIALSRSGRLKSRVRTGPERRSSSVL